MNHKPHNHHRVMPDSTIKTSIRVPLCRCFAGVALLLLLALAPAAWATQVTLTVASNAVSPWTVPTGVTSVTVEMWGGGGGGGYKFTAVSAAGRGGGGGGGGYSRATLTGLTPGSTIAYSVGGAGAGGNATTPANASAGANTTFTGVTTANGGSAGANKVDATVPASVNGGTGGTANGGAGEAGSTANTSGGGAGGAAGWNGSAGVVGAAGGSVTSGTGGVGGGTAPSKGGNGGNAANGAAGGPGNSPGGGGAGGSGAANASKFNGGAGAAGTIILTYADAPTVTTPTATAITDTTATLGANVTSDGGSALTSRGTVWGTSAAPTGNSDSSGGTATGIFTQARTGLPVGTQIFYRGFAINGLGTSYSADGSFYTLATPATTASSALNFTGVGETSMTVNWTSGNGGHRIVIAKAGSAPSGTPANATVYTANANYTSGQALAGGFVVYDGTDSPSGSVTVSGLTASTTYYFVVYEYNEAGSTVATVNYLTSSSLSGNQATAAAVTPTIIVLGDPVTLAYGNLGINSTSNQTYSISGVNLTADISITAPTGYQISTTSGTGFGSALTLTQVSGTVASTNIYVRFAPTAVQSYSGNNVTNSSAGAPTVNVAVTGTGIAVAPTVSSTAADSITGTSATLHGSIDADGGGTITDRGFAYGTSSGIANYTATNRGTVAFITSGTWTCPAGVTSVQVECWGGGGAGGSATKISTTSGGGGGGGGAYVKANTVAVTAGNNYTVTVGAGGISSLSAAVPGGDTSFAGDSSTITAKGGGGAPPVTDNAGAAGAHVTGSTVGDLNNEGGDGIIGVKGANGYGGGGGGGAGNQSPNASGVGGNATASLGGAGGAGNMPGGRGAAPQSGNNQGNNGVTPGGGGSGGRSPTSAGSSLGGTGGSGQVVLTYNGNTPIALTGNVLGLNPNAQYFFEAFAVNSATTTYSSERNFYTLANVPTVPTVNGATTNSLNVRVNVNGNPATTEFAIQETNSLNYVQANGTLGGPTVWQTTNLWHAVTNFVTVTGLIPGSNYVFQVKARNGDNTETAFSPAAGNTVTKATTTITGVTASQSISYGTTTVTLSGTVSAGTLFPANGETVSVIINATTNPATISGGAGGFSVNFPTATILPSLTPYTITYAYGGSATLKTSSDATTALTVNGVKVPALAYTNGQGISRQITLSEIQSAGLFSPQPSPTYTITLPSASSTGGGSVITNGAGTLILYTPPSGSPASDSFSYTVSDGTASATATVSITFQLQASGSNPQISVSGGAINGTLYGIPTVQYDIQRKTNLSDTVWQTLSSPPLSNAPPYTADASSGKISFTDTNPPPSSGYYRTIQH